MSTQLYEVANFYWVMLGGVPIFFKPPATVKDKPTYLPCPSSYTSTPERLTSVHVNTVWDMFFLLINWVSCTNNESHWNRRSENIPDQSNFEVWPIHMNCRITHNRRHTQNNHDYKSLKLYKKTPNKQR